MDGENQGKPYEQIDDLGVQTPLFLVQHPYLSSNSLCLRVFPILPWQDVNSYIPSKVSYGEACGGKDKVVRWRLFSLKFCNLFSSPTSCHNECHNQPQLGGGFKLFFIFTPTWGNDPI